MRPGQAASPGETPSRKLETLAPDATKEYQRRMESCRLCGGDGRIGNAFGGSSTTCPGCRGSGRRSDSESILRDVTKTKPSHHRASAKEEGPVKATWPATAEGAGLASEVKACAGLPETTKARLIREIIDYEGSHGKCTQTFTKKIRKQVRPSGG